MKNTEPGAKTAGLTQENLRSMPDDYLAKWVRKMELDAGPRDPAAVNAFYGQLRAEMDGRDGALKLYEGLRSSNWRPR